jgi:hypothetical protein
MIAYRHSVPAVAPAVNGKNSDRLPIRVALGLAEEVFGKRWTLVQVGGAHGNSGKESGGLAVGHEKGGQGAAVSVADGVNSLEVYLWVAERVMV